MTEHIETKHEREAREFIEHDRGYDRTDDEIRLRCGVMCRRPVRVAIYRQLDAEAAKRAEAGSPYLEREVPTYASGGLLPSAQAIRDGFGTTGFGVYGESFIPPVESVERTLAKVRAFATGGVDPAVAAGSGLTEKPRDDAAHSIDTDGRCAECEAAEPERPPLPKTSEHPDVKRAEALGTDEAWRAFNRRESWRGGPIPAFTAFYAGSNAAHALRDAQAAQVAKETEEGAAQMDAEDYHAMIPDYLRLDVSKLIVEEAEEEERVANRFRRLVTGDSFEGGLTLRFGPDVKPETIADSIPEGHRDAVLLGLLADVDGARIADLLPSDKRDAVRAELDAEDGDALGGRLTRAEAYARIVAIMGRVADEGGPRLVVTFTPTDDPIDLGGVLVAQSQYEAVRDDLLKQLAGQAR